MIAMAICKVRATINKGTQRKTIERKEHAQINTKKIIKLQWNIKEIYGKFI